MGIMIGIALTVAMIAIVLIEVLAILGIGLLETGYIAGASIFSEIQMCLPFGFVRKMEKRRHKEKIMLTKLQLERALWTKEWIKENGKKQKAKDDRYIRRTLLLTKLWSVGLYLPQGLAQIFAYRLPVLHEDTHWSTPEGCGTTPQHAYRFSFKLLFAGTCMKMAFPEISFFGLPIEFWHKEEGFLFISAEFINGLSFGLVCAILIPLILKLFEATASIRMRYLAIRTHRMMAIMKTPCTEDRYINDAVVLALRTSLAQLEAGADMGHTGEDADYLMRGFDPRVEKTDPIKQREASGQPANSDLERWLRKRYVSMGAHDAYLESLYDDPAFKKMYDDYRIRIDDHHLKYKVSDNLEPGRSFAEEAQIFMNVITPESASKLDYVPYDIAENYGRIWDGLQTPRELKENTYIDLLNSSTNTSIDDWEDDVRYAYGYRMGDAESQPKEPSIQEKVKARYDATKEAWDIACANKLIGRWKIINPEDPMFKQVAEEFDRRTLLKALEREDQKAAVK